MPTEHPTPITPKTESVARYAISLVLLVVVIGGIAWLVQHLPRSRTAPKPVTARPRDKELVSFLMPGSLQDGVLNVRAVWEKANPGAFREFETGESGHFDFLFKNFLGEDIEVLQYLSTCACTSVVACMLSAAEVDRLGAVQAEKPGDPLPYQAEPAWEELPQDPLKAIHLKIKATEGGVVRVNWNAKKAAGSELRVNPSVFIQAEGDPSSRREFKLYVPAVTTYPVRIFPPRVSVGTLIPGSVVKAEFEAWSATRDEFKFGLVQSKSDPFFEFATTPLTKTQCAGLEKALASNSKVGTHVKAGYHVTVTVHESKGGQQLDLGSFFRRFAIVLDGTPMLDLPGPEIVGRVQGDLVIGGADDQGKIRFKSFDIASGARQPVDLLADAAMKLEVVEHHPHQPTWLNIRLTPDKQVIDGKKRVWHLEVTVPPNTRVARSFDEPDAVVLQIVGDPPRYVRIPIEGHVGGR